MYNLNYLDDNDDDNFFTSEGNNRKYSQYTKNVK